MRTVTIVTALVSALCAAAVTTATAAARLPRSPIGLNTPAHGLVVRPHRIIYTGDGTGILSGRRIGDQSSDLVWTRWNATTALGSGFDQLNDCDPSCAGGTFTAYPVRIEVWRPRTIFGALVFTRMTLLFTGRTPPGTSSGATPHYTFTDVHNGPGSGGGFGWGPPDAKGYCVDRHGGAAFAGCANIAALPPAGLF